MKKILFLALALGLIACEETDYKLTLNIGTPTAGDIKAEHVIFIGLDAWGSYSWEKAEIPNIKTLAENGAYTLEKRSIQPSVSLPNWAAMFTGCGTETNGYIKNSDDGSPMFDPTYVNSPGKSVPTFFRVLRDQRPESVIGCLHEWKDIAYIIDVDAFDYCYNVSSINFSRDSKNYIKKEKPNLFMLECDTPDQKGHTGPIGHGSDDYYAELKKLDKVVGDIIQATKDAGIYDDTIFVITADHGGRGTGHEEIHPDVYRTPFVISGKNVKKIGRFDEAMVQYDVAPTIAEALGLEAPQVWTGKSMSHVFK